MLCPIMIVLLLKKIVYHVKKIASSKIPINLDETHDVLKELKIKTNRNEEFSIR